MSMPTRELTKLVTALESDLRCRVDDPTSLVHQRWRPEHADAVQAGYTNVSWPSWRDERVAAAAVDWIMLTILARYCEDNRLISRAFISGPDTETRQYALTLHTEYLAKHPGHTDVDWLLQIAAHFHRFGATRTLVAGKYIEPYHPAPSPAGARMLLDFWRGATAESEAPWSLTGAETIVIGDLYQYLSEHSRKQHALVQTPEFVANFILDQTLEPALAERPLEDFTLLDPTCGTGHFLVLAFRRLMDRWRAHAPDTDPRELARRALASVYGVDLNPYNIALATFRLGDVTHDEIEAAIYGMPLTDVRSECPTCTGLIATPEQTTT